MKIDNSTILMSSNHDSSTHDTVHETLRLWVGNQRPDFEGTAQKNLSPANAPSSVVISLSDLAKAMQAAIAQTGPQVQQTASTYADSELDPKMQLLLQMLEKVLGVKIRLVRPQDFQLNQNTQRLQDNAVAAAQAAQAAQSPQATQPAQAAPTATQPQGWGLEYDRSATHYEAEKTDFAAQGIINTTDGQTISFNLNISMQREFQSNDSTSIRAGDGVRKDPLVINFSGTAAELTNTKFAFDIDSDGKKDTISFVGTGSGFLALDLNNNGKIDNGSELFGTQNGNGFADIAKYDSDGNHWIDQNDAVFNKLRVWSKDAAGKDSLSTLSQLGVGALYLGSTETLFSAKNTSNQTQGLVRSSGVYLKENGTAGTLQQLDLTV